MAPGSDFPAQFGIERLDGIGRIQNPPHLAGEGIERDDLGPGASPALADSWVFPAPRARLEGAKRGLAGIGIDRPVDVLQCGRDRFAVFPGDEIETVA